MASRKQNKGKPPNRLRVAAVQMKFAPTIDGNLAAIRRLLAEAARRRADAVLFPECAVTGYAYDFPSLKPKEVEDALSTVGRMAAECGTNVLVGSPVFGRGRLYNCLVVFNRRGEVVHCYAKCQLTEMDLKCFTPGNAIALFEIDGVLATTVICHERRYPELVRLAVMAGAKIVFHPNAGMDRPAVSRKKRGGQDGIAARAFENAIYYVFANSVGPQGGGLWSAGDSKIVAPNERVLKLADNHSEAVLVANLDLAQATRRYAVRGMERPRFLASEWKEMVRKVRKQASEASRVFALPNPPAECSQD
ncbi:MAG: carbon-nitrogen hydrolase family protein [Planctomycetota bacterium]